MTGSIALDVVIGLIFIYLLYSLFATVIMEIINTFCGLRARNLRYALRRMLKDEKDPKGFWRYLIKVVYKLVNFLTKPIGFAIDLKNDDLFKEFYAKPSVKYLSAGGTANKPSYITSQNFSRTLIDVIQQSENPSIPPNRQNLIEKIQKGISQLPDGSDTKKHLESLLSEAQNDIEKFKALLEQWFNETMERAAGWFKRRVHLILFLIGFILAVSFNADTLVIIKKLSNDPEGRAQLVELATNYTKDNAELIAEINRLRSDAKNAGDTLKIDETAQMITANAEALKKLTDTLKSDISKAQSVINTGWKIPKGKEKLTFINKLSHVFKMDGIIFENLWGYLLTAIAISMGSPFWFDLLNRLIQLRNSVKTTKKGGETTGNSGTSATSGVSTINRVG